MELSEDKIIALVARFESKFEAALDRIIDRLVSHEKSTDQRLTALGTELAMRSGIRPAALVTALALGLSALVATGNLIVRWNELANQRDVAVATSEAARRDLRDAQRQSQYQVESIRRQTETEVLVRLALSNTGRSAQPQAWR